jgi:hypothetical protein
MGARCTSCQGSGRLSGLGYTHTHLSGVTCGLCQGLGYRSERRSADHPTEDVEVGKVLAYDATTGAARIYLEETLQQGDTLLVLSHGIALEFEVETMVVAGMKLSMALRGWEVTMLVPQALQTGAWLMRKYK